MYNFSVIIPHKNSVGLLQRCLDSIPIRDDLQVIIVDDASSDKVVDFEEFPGKERPDTVCIFDKTGKGAGHARNVALSIAVGKWLIFADADDYFAPAFSEILDKYKDDCDTDMVFLNYCKVREDGTEIPMPVSRYIANYQNKRLLSEKVLRYSAWAPWSRMIKRNLQVINNLFFEELPFGNDMMFILKSTSQASRIMVESECAYYYYSPTAGSHTFLKFHDPELKELHIEKALKLWHFCKVVGYPFTSPVWRTERSLGIKASKKLKDKYGFKDIFNVYDTLLYLLARLFKIIWCNHEVNCVFLQLPEPSPETCGRRTLSPAWREFYFCGNCSYGRILQARRVYSLF